jgi:nicotinate-nucleotide adenylyltransferase
MRLGLFGGSFDPIHFGHLLLAESCREQSRLDQVWFVPAATPPHKRQRELSPAVHRLEMLRLALGGHDSLQVTTLELDRGGISYTVDTLREVQRQQPGAELFLLMGADSLVDLPHWREPAEICRMAVPLVVRRAGAPEPAFELLRNVVSPDRLLAVQNHQVEMPVVGFSSSDIRQRVHERQSIRYLTPRAVETYIETHGLYREEAGYRT